MRPIVFVSDFGVHPTRRGSYLEALQAFIGPVLKHLPQGRWADEPDPDALNVRFFVITLDRQKYDVFVGHGLADKAYSHWHSVRDFPYVFCSGSTWFARYQEQGAPAERLRVTGFPKLDPLFDGTIKRRGGKRPRILWAPTHPTSWPRHYQALQQVMRDLPFEIVTSAHPLVSKRPTLQPLADADVVIADGGSTLYEAWALGKPVVFPTWIVQRSRMLRPNTLERDIYQQRIGYHAFSRMHLIEQIESALADGITEPEREFVEGILPTHLRGNSGKAMADALSEIAEGELSRAA